MNDETLPKRGRHTEPEPNEPESTTTVLDEQASPTQPSEVVLNVSICFPNGRNCWKPIKSFKGYERGAASKAQEASKAQGGGASKAQEASKVQEASKAQEASKVQSPKESREDSDDDSFDFGEYDEPSSVVVPSMVKVQTRDQTLHVVNSDLLNKVLVGKDVDQVGSRVVLSNMTDSNYKVLLHFVDHHVGLHDKTYGEHDSMQIDSLFTFHDYLVTLKAALADKWNVCNFDKWLVFQMVAQLEHTEVSLEVVELDAKFSNFATIDSRIRLQVGYIVNLCPEAEYLVPWMTSCYSFAYDLTNLDRSVVAFYDLHHFVRFDGSSMYVHAYKRVVRLPGQPDLLALRSAQHYDASTQSMYDPSGRFVLVRHFGDQGQASTVCTRHGEVLHLDLHLNRSSLAVLTTEFAVVLDASQGLCLYDLLSTELLITTKVEPALYCHLAASCLGDVANGCVAWCEAKPGKQQGECLLEDILAFTAHDQQVFKVVTNLRLAPELLHMACTANTLLHFATKKDSVWFCTTINLKKDKIQRCVGRLTDNGLGVCLARVPEPWQLQFNTRAFKLHSAKFALPVKATSRVLPEWIKASMASTASTASTDEVRHYCLGNLKTARVVHVANLDSHVCLLGEEHARCTIAECTAMDMFLKRMFELVKHNVDVFVESQQPKGVRLEPHSPDYRVDPKYEYLEGGYTFSTLENVRDFFAEHPGTARMHYFNVRERAGETLLVTKYMPKHAHKFLNESAMPDKKEMQQYFLENPVRSSHYSEFVQFAGPAFLAGLNEKLIASFKQIRLPELVKAKLGVASLRTVLFGNKHNKHTNQVLLTDILVFYNWLAIATQNAHPTYVVMYTGDHHVRNFRVLLRYFALVCKSHIVDVNLLEPSVAFDILNVDQLVGELLRTTPQAFV